MQGNSNFPFRKGTILALPAQGDSHPFQAAELPPSLGICVGSQDFADPFWFHRHKPGVTRTGLALMKGLPSAWPVPELLRLTAGWVVWRGGHSAPESGCKARSPSAASHGAAC